ncbi:PQQ-binding-like beta-propeller repeat protein [Rubrivivax sp. A210]|uniref:outer membrane protein assembly factor BamB family protein n=1 Tax=Rubrivivax sp. A210 TaxID=2772301 RepID=UPI00191B61F4|nr:hypothetical protein [Rubrivivax sp. A210]
MTPSTAPDTPLHPVPDGMATPDGRCLCVPAAAGGVAAVEAETGAPRWRQDSARLAVLAREDRVLVLEQDGSTLRPRWLALDDGTALGQAGPPLFGAAGSEVEIAAVLWSEGRLLLGWRDLRPGGTAAEGGACALDPDRLDLPARPQALPPIPPWPGTPADPPLAAMGQQSEAWRVAGFDLGLTLAGDPANLRRLVLLRREGARTDRIVLMDAAPSDQILHRPSPDAGFIALLHITPASGGSRWRFFGAPHGEALGQLDNELGLFPPFCRVGPLVVARQFGPRMNKRALPGVELRAWRLADGQPLWRHALSGAVN